MTGNYKIIFLSSQPDLLLGMLAAYSFEAFEETPGGLEAWLPVDVEPEEVVTSIRESLDHLYEDLQVEFVELQNWNAVWESRFDPVRVDDYCYVRAEFHTPISEVKHDVILRPQMAFGTGHHETTYMMLDALQSVELRNKRVLDLGCGTGVLGIVCAQESAAEVVAVDVEKVAIENARVNAELNDVHLELLHGSLDVVTGADFDLILANINRNAIMFLMADMVRKLGSDGLIYFSGFLTENEQEVGKLARSVGLIEVKRLARNDWICLGFRRA